MSINKPSMQIILSPFVNVVISTLSNIINWMDKIKSLNKLFLLVSTYRYRYNLKFYKFL